MIYLNIDSQISDENMTAVMDGLRSIDALLPFTVNLTPEDRMRLPVMGKKSLAFTEGALGYAERQPRLIPPCMDLTAAQRDFALAIQLRTIRELLGPLWQKVNDTYLAAGAEAYAASRTFYSYVKIAAKNGVPGSTSVSRDLGERYKISRSKSNDDTEPAEIPAGTNDGSTDSSAKTESS